MPLALWPALLKIRAQFLSSQVSRFDIPINQCVHYGSFRYGLGNYNPVERYICDVTQQRPLIQARGDFIQFLLHYRPRHMGEALGAEKVSQFYPLWQYPWDVIDWQQPYDAWGQTPQSCPDIMTHFSETGIPHIASTRSLPAENVCSIL